VAGGGEPPLADFRGRVSKAGVVLEWTKYPAQDDFAGGLDGETRATTVELTRTTLVAPPSAAAQAAGAGPALKVGGAAQKAKAPPQMKLVAGNVDAGGVVDRTAQIGFTYRYTAERVRKVTVNGQTVELRSADTQPLQFEVTDVFPPSVPTGLVAVPAFAGKVAAIDLSWEPDVEPRVAGYRVYRREGAGMWRQLTVEVVGAAAYRDTTVVAGRTYAYRVTAVSTAGNESAAGNEVEETAPQGQ